jgi:predicted RNA binding protein YcfA (HicA-like mRNA interferase family)
LGRSIERLIELIYENPIRKDFSHDDFKKVASHYGFKLSRTNGSHRIYVHTEMGIIISVPFHGKDVKPIYIRKFRDCIDSLDLT